MPGCHIYNTYNLICKFLTSGHSDCFIKPLKDFLSIRTTYSQFNSKDDIICKDPSNNGKSVENIEEKELKLGFSIFLQYFREIINFERNKCSGSEFSVLQSGNGIPIVSWNGTDDQEPPFSKYILYYEKLMNIGSKNRIRIIH